jgi:hypothetical protein
MIDTHAKIAAKQDATKQTVRGNRDDIPSGCHNRDYLARLFIPYTITGRKSRPQVG